MYTFFGIYESRFLWFIVAAYAGAAFVPLVLSLPYLPDPTELMKNLDDWATELWARLPFRRAA